MSATAITQCRLCKNPSLIEIFNLGDQALASRFPWPQDDDPISAPLTLVKCDDSIDKSKCGLVQLSHNVSADELYLQHYGYRSGLNNTMINHLKGLVDEIEDTVELNPNDIVVDIGSNDSTLLRSYSKPVKKVGIDPTGVQFKQYYTDDITLIPDFFSAKVFEAEYPGKKARVVTTISMFYDLPDPHAFAKDLKSILAPNGIWVSEQSYCVSMLEKNSFDTICHEHLEYYAIKQFQHIADSVGLKILNITLNECNGGSFRIMLTHTDSPLVQHLENLNELITREQGWNLDTLTPYNEFIQRCDTLKDDLVGFLQTQKASGKSIYLYGASTKGNTLLQYFNLNYELITAAAERNPEKYGRQTPQTRIPIISEADMRSQKPDFLLVLPWHFKHEFLEREQDYMNQGGSIIFPLPQLEIYSAGKKKRSLRE